MLQRSLEHPWVKDAECFFFSDLSGTVAEGGN